MEPAHPSSPILTWLSGALDVAVDLSGHLLLLGELAFIAGVVLFGAGKEMGFPHLFWHENPRRQRLAGFAVMLLIFALAFVGFLASPWAAAQRMPAYDYLLKAVFDVFVVLAIPIALFAAGRIGVRPETRLPFVVGAAAAVVGAALLSVTARALAGSGSAWLCDVPADHPITLFYGDACDYRIHHHVGALIFFGTLGAMYLAGLLRLNKTPMPAVGTCILLALIAVAERAAKFWLGDAHAVLIIALVLALFWMAGLNLYKLRYPALASYYEEGARVPLAHYVAERETSGAGLLEPSSIPWATAVPWSSGKRPLVLICASGGGMRASVWTAAVLCELEKTLRGFPYYVRLVTGASGGMVGASFWAATLRAAPAQLPELDDELHDVSRVDMVERSGHDCLSPLMHALVYRDIAYGLSPFRNPLDRGVALEEALAQSMPEGLGKTFGDLRDGEAAGWRPSLIMSPMIVEDGRRLVISNLNLDPLLAQAGPRVDLSSDRSGEVLYSHAGYEAGRLFPGTFAGFPIRTAVRMSAAFPFVTPASVLPTEPRRRVVDAGYWDNYGVSLGCAFLLECLKDGEDALMRRWLTENVSGVLLVQIRSGVDPREAEGSTLKKEAHPGPLSRGMEWLISPVTGLFASQGGAMLFRNDEQIEALSSAFAKEKELGDGFFTTVTFSFRGDASLSWYLTKREMRTLSEEATRAVGKEAGPLTQWWSRKTVTP